MSRIAILALLLASLTATAASATRLEVHSDITRGQVTLQNRAYSNSGPAPFVTDLPAGRYDLFISQDGRRLGGYVVDIDRGVHLRGGRWTRFGSSALLPGSGQFRGDGWLSGVMVGGSVAGLLGRSVYLNTKAGDLRDQLEGAGGALSDELVRAKHEASALERTRDNYLILTGAFYAGNLMDGIVRRGSIRFRETGSGVITARYRPVSTTQTVLLSALWPGLGQVRQGSITRARMWNLFSVGVAVFWGEAQQQVENARADRDTYVETHTPADPGFYETAARFEGGVNEQQAVARTAAYMALVGWAYNLVDAALVARRSSADAGAMASNSDEEPSSWSFAPGLVGKNVGMVLNWSF